MSRMDAVRNAWRRALWRAKVLLKVSNPSWPVIWTAPQLNSTPSSSLVEGLTTDQRARLDAVYREIQVLSCCYNYFPQRLDDGDWHKLLRCSTMKQRLDQVKFARRKEELAIKDLRRETARRLNRRTSPPPQTDYPPLYLPHAKLCRQQEQMEALRYIRSLVLEPLPALAIDCQFLSCLSPRALNLTLMQIQFLISHNRTRPQPWPVHLCNLRADPLLNQQRRLHLQMLDSSRFPAAQMSSRSFVDLFPDSNIVYLSPHADQEIDKSWVEVEGNEVFVLGGIVDRAHEPRLPKQASLKAASQAGVPARRLPLDTYVKWKSGSKYLTLTAVASILYDVYDSGGCWELALNKNIPVRNVRSAEERSRAGRMRRQRIHEYEQTVLGEVLGRLGGSTNPAMDLSFMRRMVSSPSIYVDGSLRRYM